MSDTKENQGAPMETKEKKNIIDRDEEFMNDKLLGYFKIKPEQIRVGDHLRITKNKYKEDGRICTYNVIQSIASNDEGVKIYKANSYKDKQYPDWILDFTNQYKQLQAYRKPDKEHNSECDLCGLYVKSPYRVCWSCRTKNSSNE